MTPRPAAAASRGLETAGDPGQDAPAHPGYRSRSSSWWSVTDAQDTTEQRFIDRLTGRDERAFNELVQLYEQRVFRLVFRMLGRRDEAEDMAQEVFVQVFKAIGTFRGDSKLSTWIYRIAVNLCKNRMKYLSRRHNEAQDEFEASAERGPLTEATGVTTGGVARPDHLVEGYQLERIVHQCMTELDPDFREVLVLRDVEDLSYEELGEITGLAEGTVKSRLHRARSMLKASVERKLGEKVG
jgi:RNA polymerase sigma-70 factor (ECF subfamily)